MDNYGLMSSLCPEVNMDCKGVKCARKINYLDKCFIDTIESNFLCQSCGECIRYERKMAKKRDLMSENK